MSSLSRINRVPVQFWRPLSRHPGLFLRMMRGVHRKYGRASRAHDRPDGTSDALWLISMRITHRCNHHCAICGQWGKKGYNAVEGGPKVMGEVPLADYKRMVDEVLPLKPHIYITGGEPFLYRPLVPLVNYMKSKGLSVQIVTNGVGLEKNAEQIVQNGWDMLCVSLDGPREIHDRCRGLPGAYDTTQKGFRKIQKLKKELGKGKPTFYTLTTISQTNQSVLMETLREAESLEPDIMVVYYSWFTSESLGQKYTAILKKELGIEPFAWKSYVRDMSGLDPKLIAGQLRDIKRASFRAPVVFVPQLQPEEIATYYGRPEDFMGWTRCLAPWFQVDIMPNGDVVNCRDFPDIIMGNVKDTPLLDIYNNAKFRSFRKALSKTRNGVFPTCSRCCGLMGY
jgi:radical SAM protein with 4Fe4S-binding SPASM domain